MKVRAFLLNPFRLQGTYALFCNIGGSSKFAGSWKELYLRINLYASDENIILCSYIMFDKISVRNVFLPIKGM